MVMPSEPESFPSAEPASPLLPQPITIVMATTVTRIMTTECYQCHGQLSNEFSRFCVVGATTGRPAPKAR
jgi:hypothetical protein